MKSPVKPSDDKKLFFVIFKAPGSKDIFLIEESSVDTINDAFDKEKPMRFIAYDPGDLSKCHMVVKKINSFSTYEIHPEWTRPDIKQEK